MLFFHIPKLLLMNKKKSAWIMLSNVYEIGEHGDSTSMSEMFQVMYLGLSRIIENEVQLAHLKNTMTTLTNHYDWGQFFSKSYKELSDQIVTQVDQIVTQVAQEISFLFHNNPIAFENIKKMVQVSFILLFKGIVSLSMPFHVTGCSNAEQERPNYISELDASHQCVSLHNTAKSLLHP